MFWTKAITYVHINKSNCKNIIKKFNINKNMERVEVTDSLEQLIFFSSILE